MVVLIVVLTEALLQSFSEQFGVLQQVVALLGFVVEEQVVRKVIMDVV
jgi:hypothetical protein